jgi:hypothetical protein
MYTALYGIYGAILGAALNFGVTLGWYLLLNRSTETEGKPSPRQAFLRPDRQAAILAVGLGTTFFGVSHMILALTYGLDFKAAPLVAPMGFLAGLALSVATSRRPTPSRRRAGRHRATGGWLLRLLVVILTFGLVQWVFIKAKNMGIGLAIVLPPAAFWPIEEDTVRLYRLLDSILVGLALALGSQFGLTSFVADRLAKWLEPVDCSGK